MTADEHRERLNEVLTEMTLVREAIDNKRAKAERRTAAGAGPMLVLPCNPSDGDPDRVTRIMEDISCAVVQEKED